MQVGLDCRGFDCSGLIIASVCEVLEVPVSDWPRDYRHVSQLKQHTNHTTPGAGNIVYMYSVDKSWYQHIGVLSSKFTVVHASGDPRLERVTEDYIDFAATRLKTVDISRVISTLDM